MLLCSQWSSAKVKRPRYSAASDSVISGASILDFDSLSFFSSMKSYSARPFLKSGNENELSEKVDVLMVVVQQRSRLEPTANIGA